jgi:hypothetical protein
LPPSPSHGSSTSEGLLLFDHFTHRPNLCIRNLVLAALSSSQSRSVALYRSILASPAAPDERTFLALLRSVRGTWNTRRSGFGKQVHAHVVVSGLHSRVYLRNSLLKMYLDAGDVGTAEAMFLVPVCAGSRPGVLQRHAVRVRQGKALQLFRDMASRGLGVD